MEYLQSSTDEEFYVAPFIDYASADGKYRKFRVCMIDGQAMAAHMAVSPRWMVHYLNADMLDSAQHRAEEAEFMLRFDQEFAVRHRLALANIDRSNRPARLKSTPTRNGQRLQLSMATRAPANGAGLFCPMSRNLSNCN